MTAIKWLQGNGDWSNPADWDSGSVPGAGDDVSIDQGFLTIGNEAEAAASLTMTGGELYIAGAYTGGSLAIGGDLAIDGGGVSISGAYSNTIYHVSQPFGGGYYVFENYSASSTMTVGGDFAVAAGAYLMNSGSQIDVSGTGTSTNNGVVELSGYIYTVIYNFNRFEFGGSSNTTIAGTLVNNGDLYLEQAYGYYGATGGAVATIGSLINSGYVSIAQGDVLYAGDLVSSGYLANAGVVAQQGPSGTFTIADRCTLSGGLYVFSDFDVTGYAVAFGATITSGGGTTGVLDGNGVLEVVNGGEIDSLAEGTATTLLFVGGETLTLVDSTLAGTLAGFIGGDALQFSFGDGATLLTATDSGDTLSLLFSDGATQTVSLASGTPALRFVTSVNGNQSLLTAYNLAQPDAPGVLDFGTVHVGDTASLAAALQNLAPAGNYSESLDGAFTGTISGPFTASGVVAGLAPGATDSTDLQVALDTSQSGDFSATATLGLVSDGAGTDNLPAQALAGLPIQLIGTVDAYAVAALGVSAGTLTGTSTNETLDLGRLADGSVFTLGLSVANAATGLADLLDGTLTAMGGAELATFGLGSFSGLGAGESDTAFALQITPQGNGEFTETILLTAEGSNASGYAGALANETLTITGIATDFGDAGWIGPQSADWGSAAAWSNGIVPDASTNATIAAAGTYTVSVTTPDQAKSIVLANSATTLSVSSTLDVATTLALTAGTLALWAGGVIEGGTISADSGTTLLATGGTLSGTALQGSLTLAADASLVLEGGLGIAAQAATLQALGSDTITLANSQTLENTTLLFGQSDPADGAAVLALIDTSGNGATVTLGIGFTLDTSLYGGTIQLASAASTSSGTLVNDGTINANGLTLSPYLHITDGGTGLGRFVNHGEINILNGCFIGIDAAFSNDGFIDLIGAGSTLELAGSEATADLSGISIGAGASLDVAGTLDNAASTLVVGDSAWLTRLALSGTVEGGTIIDRGNGLSFTGASLVGVAYQGSIDLSPGGFGNSLLLTGGFSGTGSGCTIATGALGSLALTDGTVDGVAIGFTSRDSSIALDLQDVTLGASVSLTQSGQAITMPGGSSPNPAIGIGGTVTNDGTITLAISEAELAVTGGGTLVNAGSLLVGNGEVVGMAAALQNTGLLSLAGAGSSLITNGSFADTGMIAIAAGATLDLNGAGTIAGSVAGAGTLIVGAGAILDMAAGASLAVASVVLAGELVLAASAGLTIAAGSSYDMAASSGQTASLLGSAGSHITNSGSFSADGGTDNIAVHFINKGAVSANSGTLSFLNPVTNTGRIDASGGSILLQQSVVGHGLLEIGAGGLIGLQHGAAAGELVDFTARSGTLDLAHPLLFLGGIEGFAAGDTIDLLKTASDHASFANNTLTLTRHGVVVANLHFSGANTLGSFHLSSDGHGGTQITHT